jgi:hypothetical protein
MKVNEPSVEIARSPSEGALSNGEIQDIASTANLAGKY